MRRLLISTLALISLCGCGTIQRADEILAWTQDKLVQVDAKIEKVKADQQARIEKYEAVVGSFDRNADGNVTLGEAREVMAEAAKTPEGRRLFLDPEFYATLLAAAGGLYGLKRGILKLYHGAPTPPPTTPAA